MDEVVGLIVEQLAKRARETAARAAAAPKAPPPSASNANTVAVATARAVQAARLARAGAAPPAAPPAPSPPPPAAAADPAPVVAAPAFAGVDLENPFGSLPGSDTVMDAGGLAPVAPDALLAAFTATGPFLAAFILSEALAPPLALRESRSI